MLKSGNQLFTSAFEGSLSAVSPFGIVSRPFSQKGVVNSAFSQHLPTLLQKKQRPQSLIRLQPPGVPVLDTKKDSAWGGLSFSRRYSSVGGIAKTYNVLES